jgi:hypothetical protein
VFVVFRHAAISAESVKAPNWQELTREATVTGPWQVAFDPAWGGPAQVTFPQLEDWSKRPENGIRFYSGTATYTKNFALTRELASHESLWLDLGNVKNLAQIELNSTNLGVLWKPPFRCQISGIATSGSNKLVVRVTNLWPNRLIGDEHEPPDILWGEERGWHNSEPHGNTGRPMVSLPHWLVKGEQRPSKGRYTLSTWNYYTKDSPLPASGLLGPLSILSASVHGIQKTQPENP